MDKPQPITVTTIVEAPMEKVWDYWNQPEHIMRWAFASDDWEAPLAENDLKVGGKFRTIMAAKDGSAKFDFAGVYTAVEEYNLIEYEMADGRKVTVNFDEDDDGITIIETFDPEGENTAEVQRSGWQAILDNFKIYAESN